MHELRLLAILLTLTACSSEPAIVGALPATARNLRQAHHLTPGPRRTPLVMWTLDADLAEAECLSFLTGYAPREGLIRSGSAAVWHHPGSEAIVVSCVGDRLRYRRVGG